MSHAHRHTHIQTRNMRWWRWGFYHTKKASHHIDQGHERSPRILHCASQSVTIVRQHTKWKRQAKSPPTFEFNRPCVRDPVVLGLHCLEMSFHAVTGSGGINSIYSMVVNWIESYSAPLCHSHLPNYILIADQRETRNVRPDFPKASSSHPKLWWFWCFCSNQRNHICFSIQNLNGKRSEMDDAFAY